MEKIEPGKYIELVYDLYKVNPDGTETLVHQVDEEDPEGLVIGVTQGIVAPLEKDLIGKVAGDTFDVVAKPDEAFGMRSDEYIMELEKEVFEVDGKFDSEMVKVGAQLPMMTADGFQIRGTVVAISDTHVKMDFNHPLAGDDVRFRGRVTLVREATAEELHPAQGCGCGCNHDSCGDDCGCDSKNSCGSGCGCN